MKCKPRKYADGGKVMEREYGGNPTFGKAVAANFGVGDGYSYRPKKAEKKAAPKAAPKEKPREINVANAPAEFGNVIAKRKKMLDET